MGPVLRYNLLRALLFAALLGVGFAAGLRGPVLVVVALVVSAVASYFVLARQRAEMIVAIQAAVQRRRERAAQREAREDLD